MAYLSHYIADSYHTMATCALNMNKSVSLLLLLQSVSHLRAQAIMHDMIYRQNTPFCIVVHKSVGLIMYSGYCKLLTGCSM